MFIHGGEERGKEVEYIKLFQVLLRVAGKKAISFAEGELRWDWPQGFLKRGNHQAALVAVRSSTCGSLITSGLMDSKQLQVF